jgi:hypothetical protein
MTALEAPAWKTRLLDSLGFFLVIWSIPVAILLVGAPIAIVFAIARWILQ